MTWFTLPSDLDLEEYASSFALPAQLAEFILDAENESEGFRVLRGHILDFAHSRAPEFTDWMAIYLELRLYPELPHVSIMALGLYPVFRAAADLLRRYTGGLT